MAIPETEVQVVGKFYAVLLPTGWMCGRYGPMTFGGNGYHEPIQCQDEQEAKSIAKVRNRCAESRNKESVRVVMTFDEILNTIQKYATTRTAMGTCFSQGGTMEDFNKLTVSAMEDWELIMNAIR